MSSDQQATVVRVRTDLPDVKISDFKTICRICLEKKPALQSLFNSKVKLEEKGNNDICGKLKSLSNIKVQLNDKLPQNICNKCINFLLTACFFKSLCEKSDAKLRNILRKSQIVKNTTFPDDVEDVLKIEHNSKRLNTKTNESETNLKREDNDVVSKTNYIKSEPNVCSSGLVKIEDDKVTEMDDVSSVKEKLPVKIIETLPVEYDASDDDDDMATLEEKSETVAKKRKLPAKDFIEQHIIEMYKEEMKQPKKKKILCREYRCTKCNITLSGRRSYDSHMKRHGVVEPKKPRTLLKCDHCDYTTYGKNVLSTHLSKEHDIRSTTYMCEDCGSHFVSDSGLKLHMRKHNPTLDLYKCSHCSYTTTAKESLLRHERTHTRDYQYTCEECGKSFITSGALSVHKKRHTGVRDQQCTLCEKNYVTRNELSEHIESIHKNTRPYVCSVVEGCSKAFFQRSKLKIHIRDVHKITTEIDIPSVKKRKNIL